MLSDLEISNFEFEIDQKDNIRIWVRLQSKAQNTDEETIMDNTITLRSLRVADLGIGTFIIIVGFFICVIAFLLSPLVKKPTALVISVSASYFIVILYLLNAPKTTADEVSTIFNMSTYQQLGICKRLPKDSIYQTFKFSIYY